MRYLDPLSIVVPIVDKEGRPTLEFSRKWQQQMAVNDTIPDLSKISVLAGSGLTGGGPLTASVTLAADVQAVLNQLAASQGTLVYKGASKWEILTPGTDAQVLTTHGAAANPTWEDAAPTVPALTDGHILVGNGSNLAADVAMSGNATIDNTGAVSVHSADGATFNAAGPTFSRTGGGTILLVQGEGLVNNTVSTFGSTSNNARFSLKMARGTIASPTVLSLNDVIGQVLWTGYGGTAYQNAAKIAASVVEPTPSDTAMGGQISFFTPALGAVSFTEVQRLQVAKQTFLGPVGIGSIGTTPDASAILDMRSTTKGVLSPRMTTTQRNAISTPADGLEVYDTTLHAKFVNYNGVWTQLGAAAGSGVNTYSRPTKVGIWSGSATAFATKGNWLLPIEAFTVDAVYASISSAISGHVYKACIWELASPTSLVTAALVASATVTPASTATRQIKFDLGSPVTLAAGTAYIISITDTSAASGTTALGIFSSTAQGNCPPCYPNLPCDNSFAQAGNDYTMASTNPSVGDTFVLWNTACFDIMLRAQVA